MDSVKALVFSGRVQEGMCATWVLPGGSLGEGECSVTSVELGRLQCLPGASVGSLSSLSFPKLSHKLTLYL